MSSTSRTGAGIALAVTSATSFGLAGAVARGLIDAGWSPAMAVTVRVAVGGLALTVPAALALRGRTASLRRHWRLLLSYGVVAVGGCQLAYFNAIAHMDVGPALLIEYTAPVLVVAWMWARYGQRPGPLTVAGALIAVFGLLLVLDIFAGAEVSSVGLTWALVAMVCAAGYFVLSASAAGEDGLPPIVLAAGGLLIAAAFLTLAGLLGVVAFHTGSSAATYRGVDVPWWVAVLTLGLVAAALPYTTGIAAVRILGSRLASFVALLEVVAAMVFAGILLGQLPGPVPLLGGVVVLAGVVAVKFGESRTTATTTTSTTA